MFQLTRGEVLKGLATVGLVPLFAFGSELCATVADVAHLPLPSASVSLTNLTTGKSHAGQTSKDGKACLSGLSEGLYSVEAHLAGFLHVRYYPVRISSSARQDLLFVLPFGEIREGGVGAESTLTGTLLNDGAVADSADICMTNTATSFKTCTKTNDLGEYVLLGPAAKYEAEIRTPSGAVRKVVVDMSVPGIYRNRLSLDPTPPKER